MLKEEVKAAINSIPETYRDLDLSEVYGGSDASVAAIERDVQPDPTEHVQYLLGRYTDIQSHIDNLIEVAAAEVRRYRTYLDYLDWRWKPYMKQQASSMLEPGKDGKYKRKYVRLGGGGIYFKKTGGWKIADNAELKQHLLAHPRKAVELQCEVTLKVNTKAVLKHVKETGEKLPGLSWEPVDELGQMKIGTTKAWTSTACVRSISAALGRTPAQHFEEEETEEE